EVTPVLDPDVGFLGDEVEEILLQVGAGAGDGVHLPLADHLREGNADLRGAHRAGEGQHHLAVLLEMLDPTLRRFDERAGVEMPEVMVEDLANRHECSLADRCRMLVSPWRATMGCRRWRRATPGPSRFVYVLLPFVTS